MRAYLSTVFACGFLLLGACTAKPAAPPADPQPEYRISATVKDLMDSTVDPNADVLWDSFETVISASGTEDKVPKTDEEWATVHHSAVTLVEATNLLLMPGRRIARPGEKATDPKVELGPEEIESKIAADRPKWIGLVHELNDVAIEMQKGVEAKDVDAILVAGNKLDKACGNCHEVYWYPAEAEARKKKEQEQLELRRKALEADQTASPAKTK